MKNVLQSCREEIIFAAGIIEGIVAKEPKDTVGDRLRYAHQFLLDALENGNIYDKIVKKENVDATMYASNADSFRASFSKIAEMAIGCNFQNRDDDQ